nr:diguanylate cyclase [Lachnospiraceae bacterium]
MSKKDRIRMGTYQSTINISFVCPVIISILEAFMLIYTVFNESLYGEYLWRYRCLYIVFLCAAVAFILLNLYIKRDIAKRFRMMNISNPVFAAFSFGWALAVTYSDVSIVGVVDPVLFMTFSLTVPLSIFLLPCMYAIIVAAADLIMLYIIVSQTQVGASIINVLVFFVFQFVLGISFYNLRIRLNERVVEEQENASIDSMTALMNRRSYSQEVEVLEKAELPDDLTYVSIDLNGLKEINDSEGHDAGDTLIRGAGECIRKCFADIGKIYRIGGDEFVVILTTDQPDVEVRLTDLKEAMKKWSGENELLLEASCGYARHEEDRQTGIRDLVKMADKKMYIAKNEYYTTSGRDRRIL